MYKNIFVIILSLTLISCASMLPKVHEMPAPDRIFIHDNPTVGDYAVYGDRNSDLVHRYEVSEVSGDLITIRYRVLYLSPERKDWGAKEWYYRQIDRSGKVLKAWAITDAGDQFPTPVAEPNTIGSLEHFTELNKRLKEPVKTKAGSFKVSNINSYIYRTDLGLVSTNSSCLEYYSNDVPFRILKREMLHSADVGAFLKTAEYIKAAGDVYLTNSYMHLYNKATQGSMDYQSTIELLEYDFSK